MSESDEALKRKHIRAAPDPDDYVQIDFEIDGEFTFRYAALIVEESPLGGCSIVFLSSVDLKPGDRCRIKVGNMAPLLSEVVWMKNLDAQVKRCGIKYLE